MDKASDKGIIYIEGSGPTYATATVSLDDMSNHEEFILLDASVLLRSFNGNEKPHVTN